MWVVTWPPADEMSAVKTGMPARFASSTAETIPRVSTGAMTIASIFCVTKFSTCDVCRARSHSPATTCRSIPRLSAAFWSPRLRSW